MSSATATTKPPKSPKPAPKPAAPKVDKKAEAAFAKSIGPKRRIVGWEGKPSKNGYAAAKLECKHTRTIGYSAERESVRCPQCRPKKAS